MNFVIKEDCPLPNCNGRVDRNEAEGDRQLARCPECGTELQWTGSFWVVRHDRR